MNSSTKGMSMKKNRGSITPFLLLFFVSLLSASESPYCSYSISSSKKEAHINEPINITFQTHQKIHNEVMFFDLKPLKSDDYEIVSIKEKRYEYNYHDAKKEFEFLLFAKKEGEIQVKFSFQIRRASDDAVAQAYTGSRDNVKSIPTIKVHIADPEVTLNIKKLAKDVDAVGDFNINMSIDKEHSNSYDSVNVVYRVQGRGYLNKNFEPLKKIEGVSLFQGKKEIPPRATKDGYIYQKEWSYALVSDKNYTIPEVKLNIFSYREKKILTKTTPSKHITITPLHVEDLLDDTEAPVTAIEYKHYITYLYNLLIFIAGYLFAKFLEYLPQKFSKKEHCCPLLEKANTPKETLRITLSFANLTNLKEEIDSLEELIYNQKGASRTLKSIKKSLIQKITKHS